GDLAFIQDRRLHFWRSKTGEDVATSTTIVVTDPDGGYAPPYQVSEDERYVAFKDGDSMSVTDLVTGTSSTVVAGRETALRYGYAWSSDGARLAYSDANERRVSAVHLYDPETRTTRLLAQLTKAGSVVEMRWVPRSPWLLFVSHDT